MAKGKISSRLSSVESELDEKQEIALAIGDPADGYARRLNRCLEFESQLLETWGLTEGTPECEQIQIALRWSSAHFIGGFLGLVESGKFDEDIEDKPGLIEGHKARIAELRENHIPCLLGNYPRGGAHQEGYREAMRSILESRSIPSPEGEHLGTWRDYTPERINEMMAIAFPEGN